ncbi:hypothetical protein MCUN1_003810 [Malassezia cuniculi]|uniref:Amino acid transporter transmembrane domain-containing protein n=1 Tax=Malassezia cuniculi TaxID=948313 RepID=A0AAF0ETR0_9BASI|nr:hypothetical protein MCUN1_003810 [Malassezia cuniculi]
METLEPQPQPEQGRTLLSRFFASSERGVIRRAKYVGDDDPRSGALQEKDSSSNDTRPEKVQTTSDIYTEYNGPQVSVHENHDVRLERSVGFLGAFFNMIAFSIALGILSIPVVVATIGIVPFILLCLFFCFASYYVGIQYHSLAMMYPGVQNLEHAGDIMFGPIGAQFLSMAQLLFSIFLQGNHALLGGYAFWYLGWRDCMVGMVAVFSVASCVFTLPRSYRIFAFFAAISFASIVTVVIIVMVAAGISGPQNMSPGDPPKEVLAFGATDQVPHSFLDGVNGVCAIFVSFGAYPGYLPVIAEMREPRLFKRSLAMLSLISLVLYVVVGCVVNNYLGQYAESPSLGSLTPIMNKVAYGLGLPTIMIAGCASGQVSAKALYIILFRGKRKRWLTNKAVDWGSWVAINIFTWTLGFVLAEVIPFFNSFLSLEAALFWSLFLGVSGVMYLWRHQHDYMSSMKNIIGTVIAGVIIGTAGFLMIAGVWAAAVSIRDQYRNGAVGTPFSCSFANSK